MLVFVADYFHEDFLGGAELNDQALIQRLSQSYQVKRLKCKFFTPECIASIRSESPCLRVIIANHSQLTAGAVEYLLGTKIPYIIYEHDHQYLTSRNPLAHPTYADLSRHLANPQLYSRASCILCQSALHTKYVSSLISGASVFNLGTNFWTDSALKLLSDAASARLAIRADLTLVLSSSSPVKNTVGAIEFCKAKNLKYRLIASRSYADFIRQLSMGRALAFFPLWPESFSRLTLEALLLGLDLYTNKSVGVLSESWFAACLQCSKENRTRAIIDSLLGQQSRALNILCQFLE